MQIEELKAEALSLVWVECDCPVLVLSLKEALEGKARVYGGQEEPSAGETPSAIVLRPNGKNVASEVRRLQALAPGTPVLVYDSSVDSRLAQTALRAGVRGIIHAGMRAAQIVRALSLASKGEIVIPRDILGELVGRRLFLQLPKILDP